MPVSSHRRPLLFRMLPGLLLLAAWCAVIFAASSRPDLRVSEDDLADFVLRKCAHLAEYAVLGWLAWRVARNGGADARSAAFGAWSFAVAYAASDEWHQSFVPGRVGHPRDVAIDAAGAAAGVLVAWHRARRPRRVPDTREQHP